MIRLCFWVSGKPAGYSRNAARWKALPEPNKVWRAAVVQAFRTAMARDGWSGTHDKAVIVSMAFHGSRCDLDNLQKELLDALNGEAYTDDRQVYQTEVARGLDPHHEPGAHVTLTFTDDDPMPKKGRSKRKKP